ncbi:MAG TPA: UDP-N-acetylmuramoyl-L-alanine--D-glutamate ligase [Thermoanaerobaculia bacterium]
MRKTTIFGAARSGIAAANFLAARGHEVEITDASATPALEAELDPRVKRTFGAHPDTVLDGTSTIVLSPGVPSDLPILKRAASLSIPVISEIELAFRHLSGRIVAITGSNGKSTTTALVGEILRAAGSNPIVAGNIGDPLIAAVDSAPRNYVLELSSFQLETVDTFRADVALLLNITPDHMDRYRTLDDYAEAKYRVFRNQSANDLAIVNGDDARTANPPTKARVWRFSSTTRIEPGAFLDGAHLVMHVDREERKIPRSILKLEGMANVENALASWLAARAMGVADVDVEIAFGTFAGLPHRMVLVREVAGVRYVNDSKGTNVDATLKSLEGMGDGCVFLILGGKDKNGEFERLRPLVEKKARTILTIGAAAEKIEHALDGATEIVACKEMSGAIRWARQNAKAGDVVLLSPACASFDQYNNFEERGRHFEELVRGL